MSVEYFACYVSNEALSIDNLFVFLFTVRSFAVPRIAQQKCCYSASSWRWGRAPDLSTAVA
jgi:predicted tellurium resistance membrane protein TerC